MVVTGDRPWRGGGAWIRPALAGVHRYSAFDTAEAAVQLAKRMRVKLGRVIVRYDIPEGVGITWELVPGDEGTGHFDLFGDKEVLKRYPAIAFHLDVVDADRVRSGEMR
jgi:hypothetical protein